MKQSRFFIGCVFGLLFFLACQKELSLEGGTETVHNGTLQCSSITVHGDYLPEVSFTDSNYISCQINVIHLGKYILYSDTVNGFYFRDSGLFAGTGLQTIILKAFDNIKAITNNNFNLYYDTSVCSFFIPIPEAVYTLSDSNQNCENNIVYGTYKAGLPLTASDSVHIQVNVTKIGTYELQTSTINGINFSGKGEFSTTGIQTMLLSGSGTPQSGGAFEFPVAANNSTCNFFVNTDYKSIDTSMYYYFEVDHKKYFGYLDSAVTSSLITRVGILNTLSIGSLITATTDTLFGLLLSRISNDITTGIYHSATASNADFAGGMDLSTIQNFIYYASSDQPSFKIELTNYTNQLVSGKFYGPVKNNSGEVVDIENGVFKSYLAH